MGLCMAVGGKSVSSWPILEPPDVHEDYAQDGTTLVSPVLRDGPLVALATSADQQLQATVTVHYYDMVVVSQDENDENDDQGENSVVDSTVAELQIQISPLAQAFSSQHRNSRHRIVLPSQVTQSGSGVRNMTDNTVDPPPHLRIRPAVCFSANRRFLSCLIPLPSQQQSSSIVVVLQLRKPRSTSVRGGATGLPPPPLPSYVRDHGTESEERTTLTSANTEIIPVATNPKIVSFSAKQQNGNHHHHHHRLLPLQTASALTDLVVSDDPLSSSSSLSSVLLAGCGDGNLVAVQYRPCIVAGTLLTRPGPMIYALEAVVQTTTDHHGEHHHSTQLRQGTRRLRGKVAVLTSEGSVAVWRTSCLSSKYDDLMLDESNRSLFFEEEETEEVESIHGENENELQQSMDASSRGASSHGDWQVHPVAVNDVLLQLEPEPSYQWNKDDGPYFAVRWISNSYLAMLQQPHPEKTVVQVHGLYSYNDDTDQRRHSSQVISTMEMTADRLEDVAHTKFVLNDHNRTDGDEFSNGGVNDCYGAVGLDYDAPSGCLAINSVLTVPSEDSRARGFAPSFLHRPFVCLWHWRTNTQGLTMAPRSGSVEVTGGRAALISKLCFAADTTNPGTRKLVHLIGVVGASREPCRIRKEQFDVGMLSPPTCRSSLRDTSGQVSPSCSLFLTSSSIAYPHVSRMSAGREYEVEWQEATLPMSYLSVYGAPTIAAMGSRRGNSIAVAASRGMCALERCEPRIQRASTTSSQIDSPFQWKTATGQESAGLQQAAPTVIPKWHLFRNELSERKFRVVAMKWWEGFDIVNRDSVDNRRIYDDLLITITQIMDGSEKDCFYLSCWAPQWLDVEHQLLRVASASNMNLHSDPYWGVRLPHSFLPVHLDVLDNPALAMSSSDRKAVILLNDDSKVTRYHLLQVQLIFNGSNETPGSYKEKRPYQALAHCVNVGNVGFSATLFLASASFGFDITDQHHPHTTVGPVATLGAIRKRGGGLGAISVSSTEVSTRKGCVIPSVGSGQRDAKASELSNYWLADIRSVMEASSFIWSLQLANGRLLCWVVPSLDNIGDGDGSHLQTETRNGKGGHSQFVDSSNPLLGKTYSVGSSSMWMNQSTTSTRNEYSVGSVPGSNFGCVLGAGQSCRKLHRSLCESFEGDKFRLDFLDHEALGPSPFVLSPPAYMLSLLTLILDMDSSSPPIVHGEHTNDTGSMFTQRLAADPFEYSAKMALQYVVLRSVERLASLSRQDRKDAMVSDARFAAIVNAMKSYWTPLQFATLFVEVGRQIEPSCHSFLFPLPTSAFTSKASYCSVGDLFNVALENGSISTSVAVLPLIPNQESIRFSCGAVFRHCLRRLDTKTDEDYLRHGFDALHEMRVVVGDIFRFGLKLEDPEESRLLDLSGTYASSMDGYMIEDGDDVDIGGYSIMCGITKWFGRNRREQEKAIEHAASSFIEHVPDIEPRSSHMMNGDSVLPAASPDLGSQTVAGVAARYVLMTVFDGEADQQSLRWKKTADFASLLVGDNLTGLYLCSKDEFTSVLRTTRRKSVSTLLPPSLRRRGGLVEFFANEIAECMAEVDDRRASCLLDLLLVLLGTHGDRDDLETEVPGLAVASLVAGHASGRVFDIVGEDQDSSLWTDFIDAVADFDQI